MTLITTKFKSGGLHEKHVVALGNLGTTSAFAFRPRETKKVVVIHSIEIILCCKLTNWDDEHRVYYYQSLL
jgi:hypothetical protein